MNDVLSARLRALVALGGLALVVCGCGSASGGANGGSGGTDGGSGGTNGGSGGARSCVPLTADGDSAGACACDDPSLLLPPPRECNPDGDPSKECPPVPTQEGAPGEYTSVYMYTDPICSQGFCSYCIVVTSLYCGNFTAGP